MSHLTDVKITLLLQNLQHGMRHDVPSAQSFEPTKTCCKPGLQNMPFLFISMHVTSNPRTMSIWLAQHGQSAATISSNAGLLRKHRTRIAQTPPGILRFLSCEEVFFETRINLSFLKLDWTRKDC